MVNEGGEITQRQDLLTLIQNDVDQDPQFPKVEDNEEDNHTKDASFRFNLKQSIKIWVLIKSMIQMMDPTSCSLKGS